ncbi:hypothetical protein ACWN8V_12745 [Vagococcus elongatus]|uniref:WYL domain-containing protein n=1 Tax=Vagococcus elongatus TaxID=180344 RepID=A0A430ALF2_9ENTE|nr:hypothetical protein [Vagococcus elongatus]RSU08951.1 hypothetical protein CBF29_12635 [Vagococcus elongatus]
MNSQKRILRIFTHLLKGDTLTKQDLMNEYQKQSSTIQRDMAIIEEILEEESYAVTKSSSPNLGALDRKYKGTYQLTQFLENNIFNDDELLAVIKILFASRSFNQEEIMKLTQKFLLLARDKQRIELFIANEQLHYHGVAEVKLIDRINLICEAILNNQIVEFDYQKCGETKTFRKLPLALHFSDLYFL